MRNRYKEADAMRNQESNFKKRQEGDFCDDCNIGVIRLSKSGKLYCDAFCSDDPYDDMG